MNTTGRRGAVTVPEDPAQVTVKDLARIDAIQALLRTLNDPRAGADVLARQIAGIPVLRARVERRFMQHHPNFTKHDLPQQIALLGNRVLESVLAELLEDLVMLHSEVEPAKRYSF
ncbi:MAG TPA: hypothetical protein VE987_03605 [Polyangiaceae bacterium]|nr:hypothetical protein [Polyangiaceae bacterium]